MACGTLRNFVARLSGLLTGGYATRYRSPKPLRASLNPDALEISPSRQRRFLTFSVSFHSIRSYDDKKIENLSQITKDLNKSLS